MEYVRHCETRRESLVGESMSEVETGVVQHVFHERSLCYVSEFNDS
jgi:hypothetical protein